MIIIGVDEVGRGPLAGPVVAAATAFTENSCPEAFTDSKKLSPKKRECLFEEIKSCAVDWSIVAIGPRTIDRINIREAAKLAMSIAVAQLNGDMVLVDGNMEIKTSHPQKTVVKGDLLHREIGAASILAKVWRDERMKQLDQEYPGFGFASHAGYPTKSHKEAIATLGPTTWHRTSFRGVAEFKEQLAPEDEEELRIITDKDEQIFQTFTPESWPMGREESRTISEETRI